MAQVGSLSLRWLMRELNRRLAPASAGNVDEETLSGRLLERDVRLWAPPSGFRPVLPRHGQVNWLGFANGEAIFAAFWNDGDSGTIACPLDARDLRGATFWPVAVHQISRSTLQSQAWDGNAVAIDRDGCVILEWGLRK